MVRLRSSICWILKFPIEYSWAPKPRDPRALWMLGPMGYMMKPCDPVGHVLWLPKLPIPGTTAFQVTGPKERWNRRWIYSCIFPILPHMFMILLIIYWCAFLLKNQRITIYWVSWMLLKALLLDTHLHSHFIVSELLIILSVPSTFLSENSSAKGLPSVPTSRTKTRDTKLLPFREERENGHSWDWQIWPIPSP